VPRCPSCDRELETGAEFCPHDGTSLTTAAIETGSGRIRAISAKDDTGSVVDILREQPEPRRRFEALIGQTLDGRYRIERILGEGGMGIVFLATHVVIEKPVAIKVLKRDPARDEKIAKRFVREARAASRISHPNIIDVTDFGSTEDGLTYSVMEYVEGSTLGRVIKESAPLPPARSLHIASQIAAAVAAAHQRGVVHRDLKPDNVFLVDRGNRPDFVKIVDFGIARMLPIPGNSPVSRLTRVGSVFGTPEYMAPEQASGSGDTDHRVDVYALGTILYEMLSGRVPHKGESTVRTLAMQMLDPIDPLRAVAPETVTAEIEAVVMKALEKKREDRLPDMAAMLEAIAGLQKEFPHPLVVAPPSARTIPEVATETELHPAGADAAETGVHGKGMTAAPTELYRKPGPGEPAFVARRKRPRPEDLDDPEDPPPRRGSATLWLGGLLGAAVIAAIVFLVARGGEQAGGAVGADAAVAATPIDAAAAAEPLDAASEIAAAARADAGVARIRRVPPPRSRRRDAGLAPPAPGFVDVEVITRPKNGSLYIDGAYAGSDGTNLRRRSGSRLAVRCTLDGHRPGTVSVRFDGDVGVAVCRMTPRKKCVEGIKNPFEDCP
jgi:serine/threonine protein kinase